MADINLFWPILKSNEGGYTVDSGGETYLGISRKYHPEWKGWPLVDQAKEAYGFGTGPIDTWKEQVAFTHVIWGRQDITDLALQFYKPDFWDIFQADHITNQSIANFIVDWGVNCGDIVVKKVQALLGVTADGIFGSGSLSALNAQSNLEFFQTLVKARLAYYQHTAEMKPSEAKYLTTWTNRTNSFSFQA